MTQGQNEAKPEINLPVGTHLVLNVTHMTFHTQHCVI